MVPTKIIESILRTNKRKKAREKCKALEQAQRQVDLDY